MEIFLNSLNEIVVQTAAFWQVFSHIWFIILPPLLYFLFKLLWMYHVNIEFWLSMDWIMLEIILPKDIEKSPKPMEYVFASLAGAEKSFTIIEEYMLGWYPDQFSLEIASHGGEVHFYIRCLKKYRNMVEANMYSQYPDVIIRDVEDYVNNVPKVVPNKEWNMWGSDFEFTKPDVFPIRTYPQFEESVTGKMIDPLSGVIEVMGKLPPGQNLWYQIIIAPTSPSWGGKEGRKVIDKLAGRESKSEGIFARFWHDIADILSNLFAAFSGPVEFKKSEKKEEQPLEFRLTPGERKVLEAVELNSGKIFYKAKVRFIYLGRRENYDSATYPAFMGAIKQFNDENLNTLKVDTSKTSAYYWFTESRLKYKKHKLFRRFKNRSMDGGKVVFSTEELATLFHVPDMNVMAPSITRVEAKRGGAPSNLPIE